MKTSNAIKFTYLYRDASNYKAWGEIVFINSERVELNEIDTRLRGAFDTDGIFNARQILVPEVFLYAGGNVTVHDHCYHEFYSVESTDCDPTDLQGRSIKTFLDQVELESRQGWHVFDPLDWLAKK